MLRDLNTASMTGENGGFVLRNIPDGTYMIRVSHVGYSSRSITVTVPSAGQVSIELVQSPHTTDETVTTARGHETNRDDVPGSVETVNASDFVERAPVSIPEALSMKPGIAVSSDMPWSQRVVIRGLMKDQVIMLVDGCRVVTATETAAEFGKIGRAHV